MALPTVRCICHAEMTAVLTVFFGVGTSHVHVTGFERSPEQPGRYATKFSSPSVRIVVACFETGFSAAKRREPMTRPFSLAYKRKLVERLTGKDAVSARQLAMETGLRQQTLSGAQLTRVLQREGVLLAECEQVFRSLGGRSGSDRPTQMTSVVSAPLPRLPYPARSLFSCFAFPSTMVLITSFVLFHVARRSRGPIPARRGGFADPLSTPRIPARLGRRAVMAVGATDRRSRSGQR